MVRSPERHIARPRARAALLAAPGAALLLALAACGSSGGSNGGSSTVSAGGSASSTPAGSPTPVASGVPSSAGALPPGTSRPDAALATALDAVAGGSNAPVEVVDQQPFSGCRQPGEPEAALGPVGTMHCGAIVAGEPSPLTGAQEAAVRAALVGHAVRFVPAGTAGSIFADRVSATSAAATVAVVRRSAAGVPSVTTVRLGWSGAAWSVRS